MNGLSTSSSSLSSSSTSSKDSKNAKSGKKLVKRGCGKDLGKSTPHSLLAQLVDSKEGSDQAQAIIRKELLLARSLKSSIASAEAKHYYGIDTASVGSTETSVPLCRVVGGTASNTRTTNTIAVKGSTIRFLVRREPTGTGTVPALVPTITFVVWRDKIPATVGAIPTILGTDANPPASTTLMLSRLGSASVTYNSVAVRNPVTDLDYHIYDVRHFELNPENYDYVTPASAYGLPAPKIFRFEFKYDFHRVKQIYATYAATDPDVNAIYFTFYSNMNYTGQGYVDTASWTVDTEFEDEGNK